MLEERLQAFQLASELIKPIIEEHPLEMVQTGAIFGPFSKFTPVDQHIDHTMRVANWLLGVD